MVRRIRRLDTPAKRAYLAKIRHEVALLYYARCRRRQALAARRKATAPSAASQLEKRALADLDKAATYAMIAAHGAPTKPRFWRTLGYLSTKLGLGPGSDAQAHGAFERALALDPSDELSRLALIDVLVANRQYGEAAKHYASLLRQNPTTTPRQRLRRMTVNFVLADLPAWGVRIYDEHLKRFPKDHEVLVGKAMLLKSQGGDAPAKQLLDHLVALPALQPQTVKLVKALQHRWGAP
ncbi:MAG: tetratricopeptide repeat protein [bacterium]